MNCREIDMTSDPRGAHFAYFCSLASPAAGLTVPVDVTDRVNAITGIAFGRADMAEYIQNGNAVDICYELNENTFNNHTTIQMMVHDIKPSSEVKG